MSSHPPPADRLRNLYARLLALYPASFRAQFEDELLQAFDDRRSEARFHGPTGTLRLTVFLVRDFVLSLRFMREPGRTPRRPATQRMRMTMGSILSDLRFSVRMLTKNPLFTAAAVLTLALGIGLNTATFSTVRGTLLRPLDGVPEPERLVQIYRTWPGLTYGSVSVPHYRDLRDRSGDAFQSMAAYRFAPMSLSIDGRTERILGALASANFFQTYAVEPTLGRAFLPGVEDEDPGAHPVVVLGDAFWRSHFGSDPDVVGRTLAIGGRPYEVVGVAPPDFKGPTAFADVPLYVPLVMQPDVTGGPSDLNVRGDNAFTAIGRLRDDATVERAAAVLESVLAGLREEHPSSYETQLGHTLVLETESGLHPTMRSAQVGLSAVVSGVVGLLLLIACVNVANLFLARARERRREIGIRRSLGASRGRVLRQLLTESLVFSAVAGGAGLLLAHVVLGYVGSIRPPLDGPWHFEIGLDRTVLLFTVGVSVLVGIAFGLAPALQSAGSDTVSAVKEGGEVRAGGSRMINGLVVGQIAVSLLLLVSSGLFLRSLQGATRIDPGFEDPAHLATATVDPGLQGYDREESLQFMDRLMESTLAIPGVTSVGVTDTHPMGISGSDRSVEVPGYEFTEGERRSLRYAVVTEGYLETMGVQLREGRTFTRQDDEAGAPVIIVNERFAERFWPGQSAVGKVVRTAGEDREVIGVVETGKYRSLGEPPTEYMYLPQRELFRSEIAIVARTDMDPPAVLGAIRELVRSIDPAMPVYNVRTMENHMGIALLPARLGGTALGVFGLLGLVLTAVGIYGVMAYSVVQRRRELAVRVAIGADRSRLIRLVLGEGMRLAAVGVGLGLLGALGAGRLIQGLLYDVSALDPVAFGGVPVVLVLVALLAVYVPARRAAGTDPMKALKAD